MKQEQERRLASVYIGAVGSEIEIGSCADSIRNLNIRKTDRTPEFLRLTKGYDARQAHIEQFLKSNHGAILLLDSDMEFHPDTLEQLRSHGLPYVSGYYMRRTYNPIFPVMYEKGPLDVWPMMPVTRVIEDMQPLGASGWGCVLIHREVFEAVWPLLKGEQFVIEDDMDVWPYDLKKLIRAINQLDKITQQKKILAEDKKKIKHLAEFIKQEFRPLRGTKDVVGSDLRFPYFAAHAGFTMMLDPEVRPGHSLNYMLSADDYEKLKNPSFAKGLTEKIIAARAQHEKNIRELI